jgi:hypothetical protein
MKQSKFYKEFALHFAEKQISELVTLFNHEVGCRGWVGMRGFYDSALIDEFSQRDIDVSAIYDGTRISFKHKVSYDPTQKRLSLIE